MRIKKNVMIVIALVVLTLTFPGILPAGSLPDTGQTKCYDANGNEINPCPSPGQSFYGQDANYAPCNPHSYTKLDGNGNPLPGSAPSWVMVRDNVTGLIWQMDTAPGTYTWQQAIDYCENLTLGVYSDWRLPTIKELSTIVDSSIPYPGPTINTAYFPNTQSSHYWSSTTYAVHPDVAFYVYFIHGAVNSGGKSHDLYVRAVRGGQTSNNFINNGNGTVTDNDTGLMWQKNTAPGTYTWEQALAYADTLSLAGHNDWRLPNRNELQSIVDYNRDNPSIDPIFSNTVSSYYWSSTTNANDPYGALVVYFGLWGGGGVYHGDKSLSYYYVRAVRAGQCGGFGDCEVTLPVPVLSQRDPGWNQEQLGSCVGQNLDQWGCAVTSLTMVAQFFNVPNLTVPAEHSETGEERIGLNPAIVDDWLTWKGAYESDCLMGHNWTILPPGVKASNRHDNSYFYSNPPGISPQTHSFIDTALANQRPVIAWIRDPNDADFTHLVVIRGRTGSTYCINDPYGGVETTLEEGVLGNYLSDKAIFSCREFYKDSDYDDVPDVDEYNYGTQTNSGYASEPVNTALGNYTHEHSDLKFPGRGIPFQFTRAYNSLDPYNGPLGYGWTHSYNVSVSEYESAAVVKWGDGKEDVYNNQGGSFVPALPGIYDTLVKNVDDTFTLTRKDQTQYQFNTTGKLTSIEDKNSNSITLTYNVDGNLTTITDTVGRDVTLTYDAQNRITQITDPLSRTIGYLYDASGDFVLITR